MGSNPCLTRPVAPLIPNTPIPADGAAGVSLTQTLGWAGGDPNGDAVTYSVAFGRPTPNGNNDHRDQL